MCDSQAPSGTLGNNKLEIRRILTVYLISWFGDTFDSWLWANMKDTSKPSFFKNDFPPQTDVMAGFERTR
ncbi:hypothetical protein BDZ91DRAFT_699909 [Kalaharituber pfeilii]|nr:hypothetical protein BDZ91DRAFT_699909 [Kalaharituber pfeilii]